MMFVALLMRPWIIMMRNANVFATLLADDVLIISVGSRMVGRFAKALDRTHEYLMDMGSRVAPSKSYNFSNSTLAREWLHQTLWPHINTQIDVVKNFRYLGAHLCTGANRHSKTLRSRWTNALTQLRRLRLCPAETMAKAKALTA